MCAYILKGAFFVAANTNNSFTVIISEEGDSFTFFFFSLRGH